MHEQRLKGSRKAITKSKYQTESNVFLRSENCDMNVF
jgi:hypothetical protein